MTAPPVVVVGGGIMGCATALFLAQDHGLPVVVLERDFSGRQASSALSASSIRQQFSCAVNIALSQWSLDFIRRAQEHLALPGQPVQLGLHEAGYLYLAASPNAAEVLRANHEVQRAAGAPIRLLQPGELAERFPWLSVDDVCLGSLGTTGEGWFDGPALWQAMRRKAQACGVRFVQREVTGFSTQGGKVTAAHGRDGAVQACRALVLCAGAWSAPLGHELGVTLPVAALKRDVFHFHSPARTPNCPLVIDPSGAWFRPEGSGWLTGAPPRNEDTPGQPLEKVDVGQFEEQLWPTLARRVQGFESVRLASAWAGYYEMNTLDQNGLAGELPGWENGFTACGFSGHGLQQAPAVGCALAALVANRPSGAPSLEDLSPSRVATGRTVRERAII